MTATLEEAARGVLALHAPTTYPKVEVPGEPVAHWVLCKHCWRTYPCDTARLFADVLPLTDVEANEVTS